MTSFFSASLCPGDGNDDRTGDVPAECGEQPVKGHERFSCDALLFMIITRLLDNMPCLTFDNEFRSLGRMVYPE